MRRVFVLVLAVLVYASVSLAQDCVKADPKHYTVMSENDQVRIIKVKYGPKEKSVMHEHPDAVAVFLTDGKIKFTMADGKTQEENIKAGESRFTPAAKHNPENMSDKPFEAVLVELKGKHAAAPAKAPAKKSS